MEGEPERYPFCHGGALEVTGLPSVLPGTVSLLKGLAIYSLLAWKV